MKHIKFYTAMMANHNFPKGEMSLCVRFSALSELSFAGVTFSFGHNRYGHEGGTIDTGCVCVCVCVCVWRGRGHWSQRSGNIVDFSIRDTD